MYKLAQHIIAVADKNQLEISNFQLQKILYFIVREYLIYNSNYKNDDFINDLYDEKFETWSYGPVIPSIYYQYSKYGSMPIYETGEYYKKYKIFDKTIIQLLNINIFKMVKFCQSQPIWKKHQNNIINNNSTYKYKLKDIVKEPSINNGATNLFPNNKRSLLKTVFFWKH